VIVITLGFQCDCSVSSCSYEIQYKKKLRCQRLAVDHNQGRPSSVQVQLNEMLPWSYISAIHAVCPVIHHGYSS